MEIFLRKIIQFFSFSIFFLKLDGEKKSNIKAKDKREKAPNNVNTK